MHMILHTVEVKEGGGAVAIDSEVCCLALVLDSFWLGCRKPKVSNVIFISRKKRFFYFVDGKVLAESN